MRTILYCSGLIAVAACSASIDEGDRDTSEGLEGAASTAITEPASATLAFYRVSRDAYCAKLMVYNAGRSPTNAWTVKVNLNGTLLKSSSNGTFSISGDILTVRPIRLNGTIAPGSSASPVPTFCASRTTLEYPNVASASGNYCGVMYRDSDGDGYGDPSSSLYTCANPRDYVLNSGDCCDADPNAHPGQTAYFSVPSTCGTYDFDCDGAESPQSNGPTHCAEAMNGCQPSSDLTACVPVGPVAAGCNGFTDYNTASCGNTWSVFTNYCWGPCSGGTCNCHADSHVAWIVPQACR